MKCKDTPTKRSPAQREASSRAGRELVDATYRARLSIRAEDFSTADRLLPTTRRTECVQSGRRVVVAGAQSQTARKAERGVARH